MNCAKNSPALKERRGCLSRFSRVRRLPRFCREALCIRPTFLRMTMLSAGTIVLLGAPLHGQQQVPIPQAPVATKNTRVVVPSAPAFEVYPDYNVGNAIAEKLRNAPVKLYNFDRASLRDVLRFMADDAGIPFVALQESSAAENTLVTFTLRASPFRALETIAKANGIQLFYENGIWFLRPINEQELIGRIYKLKYNSQQNVTYNGDGSQSGATTNTSTPSTGSGIPDMNINIQGGGNVFEVATPEIVDQIKSLLGIPTSGISGQMAGEASVENFGQLQTPQALNPAGSQFLSTSTKGDGGAQVIYNADSGTIYVIATRQQHHWVEGFLSAADRPQALIGIEVKFFETTRDPKKELGINWAGTLEGGYNVTLAAEASATGGLDTGNLNTLTDSFSNLNTTETVNGVATTTDTRTYERGSSNLGTRETGFSGGYSAILSPDAVSVSLEAFLRDKDTTTVQYPRVLTINNREVAIRSVLNQPVLASTSSVTPGVGGTTTASVSYLPIGTIINVLPKTMPDNSVVLNVAITVSSIIGQLPIDDNFYPIASSRVFNAALQVDSGYTLAVGGIDEAYDQRDKTGVPFLKDIPGVGELFKSRARSQRKKNLIIFITPTIIHNRAQSSGISEAPASVLPVRPGEPTPPAFTTTGRLVGGFDAIDEAIAWLQRQIEFFKQIAAESRTDKDSLKQLKAVLNTTEMLIEEVQRIGDESPDRIGAVLKKEDQILTLRQELDHVLKKSEKNMMEF